MAEIVISEFMDLAAVESLKFKFDVLYDPDRCCQTNANQSLNGQ
jgi:hypothetical protein